MWNNTISFYIFLKEKQKNITYKDHTKVNDIPSLLVIYKKILIFFENYG
jgi:hypothetical protein